MWLRRNRHARSLISHLSLSLSSLSSIVLSGISRKSPWRHASKQPASFQAPFLRLHLPFLLNDLFLVWACTHLLVHRSALHPAMFFAKRTTRTTKTVLFREIHTEQRASREKIQDDWTRLPGSSSRAANPTWAGVLDLLGAVLIPCRRRNQKKNEFSVGIACVCACVCFFLLLSRCRSATSVCAASACILSRVFFIPAEVKFEHGNQQQRSLHRASIRHPLFSDMTRQQLFPLLPTPNRNPLLTNQTHRHVFPDRHPLRGEKKGSHQLGRDHAGSADIAHLFLFFYAGALFCENSHGMDFLNNQAPVF